MRVISSAWTYRHDANVTVLHITDVSMPGHPSYEARVWEVGGEWAVEREGSRGETIRLGNRPSLAGALELARAGEL